MFNIFLIVGCFQILQNISTIDGIIASPTAPPQGCHREYITQDDVPRCQNNCAERRDCYAFTFFPNNHPESLWKGECLVCTEEVVGDNRVHNEYATSGERISCPEDG